MQIKMCKIRESYVPKNVAWLIYSENINRPILCLKEAQMAELVAQYNAEKESAAKCEMCNFNPAEFVGVRERMTKKLCSNCINIMAETCECGAVWDEFKVYDQKGEKK